MKVEIFTQMIEPGVTCIMNINASCDVMNRGIRSGAEVSRPSSRRIRDGRGTTKHMAKTFWSGVSVDTIKRHNGKR
jgi:hypothetical protein